MLIVTFLFAGSTALMLTGLSVCVSVWSQRSRDATMRIYLLLAAILILPLVLINTTGWGLFGKEWWKALGVPVVEASLQINPFWIQWRAMGNQFAFGASLDMLFVFRAVGLQLLVALGAILMATFAVRRVHLGASTAGTMSKRRFRRLRFPRWNPSLHSYPMRWKEMFAGTSTTRLGFIGSVASFRILLCSGCANSNSFSLFHKSKFVAPK